MLLWIVVFAAVLALVGLDLYNGDGVWGKIMAALAAGIVSFVLAGFLELNNRSSAFYYGLIWAIIALLLDAIVTIKFNADILRKWTVWIGYLLIIAAPQLRIKIIKQA